MSSILDALKKLEAERTAKQAGEPEPPEEFHEEAAEEVLAVTRRSSAPEWPVKPSWLMAGAGIFAVVLVIVSVTVSFLVTRASVQSSVPPITANVPLPPPPAAAPEAPEAPAPAPTPAPAAPVQKEKQLPKESKPAKEKVAAKAPEPAPAPPAPKASEPVKAVEPQPAEPAPELPVEPPKPAPVVVAKNLPPPMPEPPVVPPTSPAPEPPVASMTPAPVPVAAVQPTTTITPAPPAPVKTPAATPRRVSAPVNLDSLPVLHSADRARFGLENLKLNVLREANDNRPNGLAIINLNKVYIGEVIPGTRAKLIDVKSHGIGIEIINTGDQFYVPH